MDDSHDSGIVIDKDDEDANDAQELSIPSNLSQRRQHLKKKNFKSLTVLTDKESSENVQKVRRRNDGNRRTFFSRANGEKRNRKKYQRKKFDKSNMSEVNIRKATDDLVTDENDKLVNVVGSWKLVNKSGKSKRSLAKSDKPVNEKKELDLEVNDIVEESAKSTEKEETPNAPAPELPVVSKVMDCFEKLNLVEPLPDSNSMDKDQCAQNPTEANKSQVDYSSGDVQQDYDALELNLGLPDENFDGMACAQIFDSKRRSVQWNREVDVIYYAGDSSGGRVIRRENEPLREEIEQQARRNRFIQLALTKKLLSNVSACQLRDPWLFVMPK